MDKYKELMQMLGCALLQAGEMSTNQWRRIEDEIARSKTAVESRAHLTNEELGNIFNGSQGAIKILNEIMREHDGLEAVTIHPDTWLGKEVLRLSKTVIDLHEDIHHMHRSIDILTKLLRDNLIKTEKERL